MRLTGKRCQCPTCKEVFSTISNFDRHRIGKHGEKKCVDPSCVGLVKRSKDDGHYWSLPGRMDL